jgi:hypothetical protein
MMTDQLIQLPREVSALSRTDLADEDGAGGPLHRPPNRLLLIGIDRYQSLTVLVAACKPSLG